MKLETASHIVEATAIVSSAYIGFDFNRNLNQLFESWTGELCAIFLTAILFQFFIREWIKSTESEHLEPFGEGSGEQSSCALQLLITDLFQRFWEGHTLCSQIAFLPLEKSTTTSKFEVEKSRPVLKDWEPKLIFRYLKVAGRRW